MGLSDNEPEAKKRGMSHKENLCCATTAQKYYGLTQSERDFLDLVQEKLNKHRAH